ncbi:hypothetical protein L484_026511 [Morus notabilis]|uniref:Uncharacterized protein n=1 Tax=Morus notabilis TaxID=981085 RepID=W9QWF9_9ROSA|nr:hypothetical protein L484_026511 [Morus notabilis]
MRDTPSNSDALEALVPAICNKMPFQISTAPTERAIAAKHPAKDRDRQICSPLVEGRSLRTGMAKTNMFPTSCPSMWPA